MKAEISLVPLKMEPGVLVPALPQERLCLAVRVCGCCVYIQSEDKGPTEGFVLVAYTCHCRVGVG